MIVIVLIALAVLVVIGLSTYTVVSPNQAHIVTRFSRGRKVYSPVVKEGERVARTAYFFIPFVMRRQVIDLTNVKMEINDIKFKDKEVAPFKCDIVCWFHAVDPDKAVERLDLEHENGIFGSVIDSLENLIQAVVREVAMHQEILEIMRDRKTFGANVEQAIEDKIKNWGVELVGLEVNDIRDDDGSDVIHSYESIRQTSISTNARKQNAERIREAIEVEQDNERQAEVRTAETQEAIQKRQIEKDKAVGISRQHSELEVAEATRKANEQKVEATRTLEVGTADVVREATIKKAEGEAEAIRITGEKQAEVTKLTGTAEAEVVLAKGTAEAKAKDAMAEALKKFNEAGITLEQIKAWVEVQKSKFTALPEAFSKANINLASSDPMKIFGGFGLDAEGGQSLAQFINTLEKVTGKNVSEIVQDVKNSVTGNGAKKA